MEEVFQYIQTNLHAGSCVLTVTNLSRAFGIFETNLKKEFKKNYGMPVRAFIIHERMKMAKNLLAGNTLPVKEIAVLLGYDELSNFSRDFKTYAGIGPREFKTRSHVVEIC